MLGLGVVLSTVLAVANKKLHVFEDPRIDDIEDMLPRANCGACGFAGCRAFAEKLVEGAANPAQCSANSSDMTEAIAALLGVTVEAGEKRVARLACAGGDNVARSRAMYMGLSSCRAAAQVGGGGKGCPWGCLGMGDCRDVCPFDAITFDEHRLPVVDEAKCTACGACVDICPKDLFEIHPISHRLWVACKNRAAGKDARAECDVACIGCGLCAKDAAPDLISIESSLACVDYSKNDTASIDAIQRCPTGAIVWIDSEKGAMKGAKAKKIERETPLPVG